MVNADSDRCASHVATRLLSLILLLQSRSGWKAGELGLELGVSERTVHRYIGMLEEMGIPIYSERGPYGGFSLVRGYRLPPLVFSAEEATVLYMGANLVKEVWGRTYGDAVTAVMAKLDNVLPDDLRQEVAAAQQNLVVSGLRALDYRPWEPTIHLLRQCMHDHRCVQMHYRGHGRDETDRIVEPYALAFQWGIWYLVGHCRLRGEMRTFRVERIQHATPLAEGYTIPRDFDVRAYLRESMEHERPHTVRIQVDAAAAPRVREHHGHWIEFADGADGSLMVRFTVATLDWAAGWALSLGPAARVLEPPELAERVRAAAEGILRRYENAYRAPTP
jgi:predicted DNA-binding transcriptional regulator YafY